MRPHGLFQACWRGKIYRVDERLRDAGSRFPWTSDRQKGTRRRSRTKHENPCHWHALKAACAVKLPLLSQRKVTIRSARLYTAFVRGVVLIDECLQEDATFQHLGGGAGRRQDLNLRPPCPERGQLPGAPARTNLSDESRLV
jgi:hypothetical protein